MAEKFSQAWVDEMLGKLKQLAAGQIWIDKNGDTVYVDSVQTKLKISPRSHHYVDYIDEFGTKWMDKKEFCMKYSYCGDAYIRREELRSFKNIKLARKDKKSENI